MKLLIKVAIGTGIGHLILYAKRLANAKVSHPTRSEIRESLRYIAGLAELANFDKTAQRLIVSQAIAECGYSENPQNNRVRGHNWWNMTQPQTWAAVWRTLFPVVVSSSGHKFMVFANDSEAWIVYMVFMKRQYPEAYKALRANLEEEDKINAFINGLQNGRAGAWGTDTQLLRDVYHSTSHKVLP